MNKLNWFLSPQRKTKIRIIKGKEIVFEGRESGVPNKFLNRLVTRYEEDAIDGRYAFWIKEAAK